MENYHNITIKITESHAGLKMFYDFENVLYSVLDDSWTTMPLPVATVGAGIMTGHMQTAIFRFGEAPIPGVFFLRISRSTH